VLDLTEKSWQVMTDAERVELLRKIQKGYPAGHNQIPKIEQQIKEMEAKNGRMQKTS
jgi:predicted Fe-S protein YdhL (DUF1289 family)